MAKGTITQFAQDFVNRVAAGVSVISGRQSSDWFGPRKPLTPVAQEVQGRQMDFQTGYNMHVRPRSTESVSFSTMRTLADSYDLLRLVIETRKDQVEKLNWSFRMVEDGKEPDERCKMLEKFFRYPDQEHDWPQWLRMLLEDMFVLDAATLYPRKTRGGELYAIELIDGATIKRIIDDTGRTPLPPEPAYQQILKGVPAADYTLEELLYRPRNVRTNKVYGYSPVEQIIVTINMALNRQASQLSYYTDGSTPDLIMSVPKDWNSDQIRSFKMWWDSILEGNLSARRGTMFVPEGVAPVNTKDAILKDERDEWLARVICYAFSVSPQPFIKEMNRATAQTNMQAALSEGLQPVMQWVTGTINSAITRWWGYDDITFKWDEDDQTTPMDRATIHGVYLDRKVLTPDEVREEIGYDPMTPEQREEAWPTPVMVPGVDPNGPEGSAKPGSEPEDGSKSGAEEPAGEPGDDESEGDVGKSVVAKKKSPAPRRIVRNRKLIRSNTKNLNGALVAVFGKVRKAVTLQLSHRLNDVKEAAVDPHTRMKAEEVLQSLDLSGFAVLRGKAEKVLKEVTKDGAAQALTQLGVEDDKKVVSLANKRAEEYAKDRAAELVGMKWVGDELIPNPNPIYRIDESTRELLRGFVEEAIAEGYSNDQLADGLADSFAFSESRAETIARTETAAADVAGNMEAYRASGDVTGKQWIVAQDEVCDECQQNADQGVIDLDAEFITGCDGPPAHPNCRCDVIPVLNNEEFE